MGEAAINLSTMISERYIFDAQFTKGKKEKLLDEQLSVNFKILTIIIKFVRVVYEGKKTTCYYTKICLLIFLNN